MSLTAIMPIYEYKCLGCGHVTSVLTPGYSRPEGISCEKCGSDDLKKIISGANYHTSASDRLSSYNPDVRQSDSFYKDSRNIGLHAEQMLRKAGVKPTDEFKNKLEKLRTDPGSVIKGNDD
ncbi:MAG TPA: FmdB family zinc ribbon protein [Desulfomonilia bacterium]|nr:FmdB family zinc ribbon protein [Desulfomonilia bacterium]